MVLTIKALEMKNITKNFLGVYALNEVDFNINKGEVHALLGENGAGKSTLMNVLAGIYKPDSGEIFIGGKQINIRNPRDSIENGIGLVHQHFKLVESLTVADNIILGWHKQSNYLNRKKINEEISEISESYDLEVEPSRYIRDLSIGQKQRVEIIKMLYREVNILALDEPTSVLTPHEASKLFKILRNIAEMGKSVIFISHKLNEVMEIAENITVLRRGKLIGSCKKESVSTEKLATMMVGREFNFCTGNKVEHKTDKVVLTMNNISALSGEEGTSLKQINLSIAAGEIVGIAGVSGNGQSELAEVLTGLRPVTNGCILLNDKNITNISASDVIKCGVSHVPEDRINIGTAAGMNLVENFILRKYKKRDFVKHGFIDWKASRKYTKEMVEKYDIRVFDIDLPVKMLSGGNLQKMVLARELSMQPELLIAVHPTYGLDVNALQMIHKLILAERDKGTAILLISEDLDEIFALSDSISVIYGGRLYEKVTKNLCDIDDISYKMAGIK
jgi:simple sugar transport system ATP-binding protein